MEARKVEKVKIYFGGVLHLKIRSGREGAPVLSRVFEEQRQLITGSEAVEFLNYLASDPSDLWQRLHAPAETLRARCENALKSYQQIMNR
jgi:hypothetical protein